MVNTIHICLKGGKNMKKKIITICIFVIVISPALVSALTIENQSVYDRKDLNKTLLGEKDVILSDEITWMKIFGGYGYEYGNAVQQTTDGGYIVIGTTPSYGPGTRAGWLIKIDEYGNEEWNKTYGGPGAEAAYDGQQTSDNGYIIVGFTDSYIENPDAWLVKTDEHGNLEWSKRYGGYFTEVGERVRQTNDGGFIFVGWTDSFGSSGDENIWLLKTDKDGNELWNKTFENSGSDTGFSVQQTKDGGYIITGTVDSDTWCDAILIKTDTNGNQQWSKTYGGSNIDGACSVQQTSDGGYIVLGSTLSLEFGGYGAWLIRTDSEGNEQWNKTFFGDGLGNIQSTTDGGFVFTDSVNSLLFQRQLRIVKINKNGRLQWIRELGTTSSEWGHSIQQTNDGGYIVVGETDASRFGAYDILVIKTDKNGRSTIKVNDFNKISLRFFFKQDFLHYFKLFFLNLL
jgi:hypothetical protein